MIVQRYSNDIRFEVSELDVLFCNLYPRASLSLLESQKFSCSVSTPPTQPIAQALVLYYEQDCVRW